MAKSIFINKFQSGQSENQNVGIGAMVGFDSYSKKGVLRLAKKSTLVTQNFTAAPTFVDTSSSGNYIWAQCEDGSVLYSSNGGASWQATNTAFPDAGFGNGMIFFQNYMIAFTSTAIYYWKDTGLASGKDPTAGAWVNWTSAKTLGALDHVATDPINGIHFPFLFPSNRACYFANATVGVGYFAQVGTTTFDPAGTINTDFFYSNSIFSLPSLSYAVQTLDFLPPNNLAISAFSYQQPQQGSDLFTWDTISSNKFSPPLRIYGNSLAYYGGGTMASCIKQLYNRNQVLYAITGGNHSIFETNASSYNLVYDIGLSSTVRSSLGTESDYPVFYNSYPSAICVVGNKLYTGTSTFTNLSTYPPTDIGSDYGIFPLGVWSISFNPDGTKSLQCEFTIPNNVADSISTSPTSPQGTGNFAKITCVKPIPQNGGGTSNILVGFTWKQAGVTNYGVSIVDVFNYIDDITNTALESELFEIGTPLNPKTVGVIEINLDRNLLAGQSIDIYYRTAKDQNWSLLKTFTTSVDGSQNYYHIDSNPIGSTQFLQLRVRMATGSPAQKYSPELKNVIINPQE